MQETADMRLDYVSYLLQTLLVI